MAWLAQVILLIFFAILAESHREYYHEHPRLHLDMSNPFLPFNFLHFSETNFDNQATQNPKEFTAKITPESQEKLARDKSNYELKINHPEAITEAQDLRTSEVNTEVDENKTYQDTKRTGLENYEDSDKDIGAAMNNETNDESKSKTENDNAATDNTAALNSMTTNEDNSHYGDEQNLSKNKDDLFVPATAVFGNQLNTNGVVRDQNVFVPLVNLNAQNPYNQLVPVAQKTENGMPGPNLNFQYPGVLTQGVLYGNPPGYQLVNVNTVPQIPATQSSLNDVYGFSNTAISSNSDTVVPNLYNVLNTPNNMNSQGGNLYYVVNNPSQNSANNMGYQGQGTVSTPMYNLVTLTNSPNNLGGFKNQPNNLVSSTDSQNKLVALPNNLVMLSNQANNLNGLNNQANTLVGLNNQPSNVVGLTNQANSVLGLNNQASNVVGLANQANTLVGLNNQPINVVGLTNQPNSLLGLNNQASNVVGLSNQPINVVTWGNQPNNLVPLQQSNNAVAWNNQPNYSVKLINNQPYNVVTSSNQANNIVGLNKQPNNLLVWNTTPNNLINNMNPSNNFQNTLLASDSQPNNLLTLGNQPNNLVTMGNQPINLVTMGTQPNNLLTLGNQPNNLVTVGNQPNNLVNMGTQPNNLVTMGTQSNNLVTMGTQLDDLVGNQQTDYVALNNANDNVTPKSDVPFVLGNNIVPPNPVDNTKDEAEGEQ